MTPAFGGQYSIQLSYGRLLLINMLCAKHADIRKQYGNSTMDRYGQKWTETKVINQILDDSGNVWTEKRPSEGSTLSS